MGNNASTPHNPKVHSSKASLQRFIQKRLIIRLCVACGIISIALATVIFFIELRRLGGDVNSRASEIAEQFNNEIRSGLDDFPSKGQQELRNKLKILLIAEKLNTGGTGRIICAGIYDVNGNEIIMEKDADCDCLDKVETAINPLGHRLPAPSENVYRFRWSDMSLTASTLLGVRIVPIIYCAKSWIPSRDSMLPRNCIVREAATDCCTKKRSMG